MKVVLFVSSLLSAFVAISAQCDACIDGSCYTRKTVFKADHIYKPITIDRTGNILHFVFNNLQNGFFYGAYYLDEMVYIPLSVSDLPIAMAVDQATRDVYIGNKELYKYNLAKNSTSPTRLSVSEDDIIYKLQFHQKLYYTKRNVKGLYTFENGESKQIPALSEYQIDEFVIDKHNDVYFSSGGNIYRLINGAKSPSLFADGFHKLATDKNGNVYFYLFYTGVLYKLNYSNDKLIEIGTFYSQNIVDQILFDRDNNIIYLNLFDANMYYLTPNYRECRVTNNVTKDIFLARRREEFNTFP